MGGEAAPVNRIQEFEIRIPGQTTTMAGKPGCPGALARGARLQQGQRVFQPRITKPFLAVSRVKGKHAYSCAA